MGKKTVAWIGERRVRLGKFIVLLAVVSGSALFAQNWMSLGPKGGNAADLVRDPLHPNVLYSVFAPGGVYKSSDGGQSWFFSGQGVPKNLTGGSLAIYPVDPSVLFLLADGKLYKSVDGGAGWTELEDFSFYEEPWPKVAVSPFDSSVIIVLSKNEMHLSVDGGAEWDNHYFGGFCNLADVAFDPLEEGVVYLGSTCGLHRSLDNGVSWTRISSSIQPVDLVFDPAAPSVLYAVDPYEGIYRTTTGGTEWTLWSYPSVPGETGFPLDLTCFVPGKPGSGRSIAGRKIGLFFISDEGAKWSMDLISPSWPATRALLTDPANGDIVLAATSKDGIMRSFCRSSSWSDFQSSSYGIDATNAKAVSMAISPSSPSRIILGTDWGIYHSDNKGISWTPGLHLGGVRAFAAHGSDDSVLIAGTDLGVYRSDDGGFEWSQATGSSFINSGVSSVIFDSADPQTVYAARPFSTPGFAKSVDGGRTWTDINYASQPSFKVLAADPNQAQVLYSGGGGGWSVPEGPPGYYLVKSTDGGASWTGLARGIIDRSVNSVIVDPSNSERLFVANVEGFFKSEDGGSTWRKIEGELGTGEVSCLAQAPSQPSILFASARQTVLRSTDSGETWAVFGTGLPDDLYVSLAVDPSDPSIVYAGSGNTGGVFRTGATTELPVLRVNEDLLVFGALGGLGATSAQNFQVFNGGFGTLQWTVSKWPSWSPQNWLIVQPASGTGNGTVSVSVDESMIGPGYHPGMLKVEASNAAESPRYVEIILKKYSENSWLGLSTPPFGSFDTPLDGAAVQSSIPVTGWALDDIEVTGVKIYRDPIAGETDSRIFIGDATFISGARPDIDTAYLEFPFNRRAGWGYMLLTHFLPDGGNGTYALQAWATDLEGNEILLGRKTITVDNAGAVNPFGAIDTPAQGGLASGSGYLNFGWALTPRPNSIPVDGSTIGVWVDGQLLGHPVYNNYRQDIATLFPGYANSNGAVGLFSLDTTAYLPGDHTIAWSVEDSAGHVDGIGSRYFSIQSSGLSVGAQIHSGSFAALSELSEFLDVTSSGIAARRGYRRDRPADRFGPSAVDGKPDVSADIRLKISELERVEVLLDEAAVAQDEKKLRTRESGRSPARFKPAKTTSSDWEGYLIVGEELRPLPVGSTLDAAAGIFAWMPGPGFIGEYRMVFVNRSDRTKRYVRVGIYPA